MKNWQLVALSLSSEFNIQRTEKYKAQQYVDQMVDLETSTKTDTTQDPDMHLKD